MAADLMKLIAYGKVMDDNSKTLKDYSIKDGDFLVVMVSKVPLSQIIIFSRSQLPSRMREEQSRSHSQWSRTTSQSSCSSSQPTNREAARSSQISLPRVKRPSMSSSPSPARPETSASKHCEWPTETLTWRSSILCQAEATSAAEKTTTTARRTPAATLWPGQAPAEPVALGGTPSRLWRRTRTSR